MRLVSLDNLLAPLLAGISECPAVNMPLEHAHGRLLASDLVAPHSVPPGAIALREGLAVRALDLVGASTHAPIELATPPLSVKAGQQLPTGCDAILDPAAINQIGSVIEVTESVEPGAHVRLSGHDIRLGDVIGRAGERLTAEILLAARIAGHDQARVRSPVVRIALPESAESAWLRTRLLALGVTMPTGDEAVHAILSSATGVAPRLALRPGEGAWASRATDGVIEIAIPARFDAMVGAWCALVLPVLAKLSGLALAVGTLTLTRKIVSTVGLTEIALLRRDGPMAHPLGIGDLTLAAMAAADAFAILLAGSEGLAAHSPIDAVMLDDPLRTRRSLP